MNAEAVEPTDSPQPATGAEESSSPRIERVRKLSRAFRLVCRLLMVFIVLVAISVTVPQIQRAMAGVQPAMVFIPTALIVHAYFFAMAWLLERMFNAFAKEGVFHPSGARYLKWLGLLFIVAGSFQFAAGLYVMAFQVFHATMLGGLYGTVGTVILGVFTLMFGWVLEEACELREQQAFTI